MHAVLMNSLYVGLGGFAGSVMRYLAGVVVAGCGLWQPLATFAVNALGALILGVVLALGAAGQGGAVARHLLRSASAVHHVLHVLVRSASTAPRATARGRRELRRRQPRH